ncbi:hypothetical protein E2320_006140 [Naja naja]|nr:hypothetical protein E2320_006140 [Naja naja]
MAPRLRRLRESPASARPSRPAFRLSFFFFRRRRFCLFFSSVWGGPGRGVGGSSSSSSSGLGASRGRVGPLAAERRPLSLRRAAPLGGEEGKRRCGDSLWAWAERASSSPSGWTAGFGS